MEKFYENMPDYIFNTFATAGSSECYLTALKICYCKINTKCLYLYILYSFDRDVNVRIQRSYSLI